jgi:predicted enzyme related to lactoylglutathione lyase
MTGDWSAALITVTLEDLGGKTTLTLEHSGMAGVPDKDLDGMRQGWNESFDKLAAYLASVDGGRNMLKLGSIMIGSAQPEALAEFYEKVLGKPDMVEVGWTGWKVGSAYFSIGAHSEVGGKASEPQRVILNFETETVKEEFDRIKTLGATVIKEPYEMEGVWIATLADPDGNYFQLMAPWEM